MNDERLTRRTMLAILVTGLITAGIALAATIFVIGTVTPTYTAKAQIALIPGQQLPPDEVSSYWSALSGGQAGRIAAEVLQQSQWRDAAAQAVGVAPQAVTVTAGVVESTSLIDLDVETTSPEGAEQAADQIIKDATPIIQQVSGPFEVKVVQPAAGTAEPSSVSASQLLIVVFIGGLLIGSGAALIIARARARSDEDDGPDSGPAPAAGGGYPRPQQGHGGQQRPAGPQQGGANGANGAYPGQPPRRPAVDPRVQPPR